MKVILFVPPGGYFAERWSQGSTMPNLGILYIAAVLEQDGVEVQVVPADVLMMSFEEIGKIITDEKPDIVGITVTTENRFDAFELAKLSKQIRPQALTVIGGPHCTHTADDTLKHLPYVDVVVRNEGEETMSELCKALQADGDLSKVTGISYHDSEGNTVHNPTRIYIKDLNDLPYPARHLVPLDKYNFQMDVPGMGMIPASSVITSRGCPFSCTFCATPGNWGRKVRAHSPEYVLDEIQFCIDKYGAKAIWFYDDIFNFNPKRVNEICDLILKRKMDFKWFCEIRVDVMTKPLLEKMASAGLFHLGFGVEAGSERVRKQIIDKKLDLDQARNVVNWSNEVGVVPNPFFIFSHPTETWEEAQETIQIMEEFKDKTEQSIAIMHVYPGTPLEKTAREMGLLPPDFTWTRKYDRRIITLPAAQGDVPLFIDKLNWWQISELLFRWSDFRRKKYRIWNKIPKAVQSIHSFGDFKRYFIMFLVYMKVKWLGQFNTSPRVSAIPNGPSAFES
jgi:anaerobic magnesium-protoporphyrin IX monomethyl ester cyclase